MKSERDEDEDTEMASEDNLFEEEDKNEGMPEKSNRNMVEDEESLLGWWKLRSQNLWWSVQCCRETTSSLGLQLSKRKTFMRRPLIKGLLRWARSMQ